MRRQKSKPRLNKRSLSLKLKRSRVSRLFRLKPLNLKPNKELKRKLKRSWQKPRPMLSKRKLKLTRRKRLLRFVLLCVWRPLI